MNELRNGGGGVVDDTRADPHGKADISFGCVYFLAYSRPQFMTLNDSMRVTETRVSVSGFAGV